MTLMQKIFGCLGIALFLVPIALIFMNVRHSAQPEYCVFICPHPALNSDIGIDDTATVENYQALCSLRPVKFMDNDPFQMLEGTCER